MAQPTLSDTTGRVEAHTHPAVNAAIRLRADRAVAGLQGGSPEVMAERLRELDEEWDIERVLQLNASVLVLAGVALGARVDRRFLLLPAAVLAFLAQHAVQGWCPPIPLLRRLGIRTPREIARERLAVKAMRGDFDRLPAQGPERQRVEAVLAAVDA